MDEIRQLKITYEADRRYHLRDEIGRNWGVADAKRDIKIFTYGFCTALDINTWDVENFNNI